MNMTKALYIVVKTSIGTIYYIYIQQYFIIATYIEKG